jgi:hypothetical protein
MRIGIDFDNTIVIYDEVWHRYGQEFGLPPEVPADKASIRAWFWDQPDGNTPWTELQGIVYGTKLQEARLAEGLAEFLLGAKERGIAVSVISHKTQFPALGPRVDLRQAAYGFLEEQGILDPQRFGVPRERVFFNDTQALKVARVQSEGCAVFVDDLPRVFSDEGFPEGVEKLLYDRAGNQEAGPGVVRCRSWGEIAERLLSSS